MSTQKHTRTCETNDALYEIEVKLSEDSTDIYTVYLGVSCGLSQNIIEAEAKVKKQTNTILNLFSNGETRNYDFNPAEEALENVIPDYPVEKNFPKHKQLSEKLVTELERLL
jgi:hypothetical protein